MSCSRECRWSAKKDRCGSHIGHEYPALQAVNKDTLVEAFQERIELVVFHFYDVFFLGIGAATDVGGQGFEGLDSQALDAGFLLADVSVDLGVTGDVAGVGAEDVGGEEVLDRAARSAAHGHEDQFVQPAIDFGGHLGGDDFDLNADGTGILVGFGGLVDLAGFVGGFAYGAHVPPYQVER